MHVQGSVLLLTPPYLPLEGLVPRAAVGFASTLFRLEDEMELIYGAEEDI